MVGGFDKLTAGDTLARARIGSRLAHAKGDSDAFFERFTRSLPELRQVKVASLLATMIVAVVVAVV